MKRLTVLRGLSVSFLVTLSMPGCGLSGLGGGPDLTISVETDGGQTTLLPGLMLSIHATVMHGHGNPAVTWSLLGCTGDCGSLSSIGANPVTYTAPLIVTASFQVTVTATASADASKSASVTLAIQAESCTSGNEAAMNGQYGFVLQGGGRPTGMGIVGMAGSFTADGAGTITGGTYDIFPAFTPPLTILPNASFYSVGADNRGCLALVTSDNAITRFRFAMGGLSGGAATRGRIIEFDDPSGSGRRAEGILRKQDPSSFSSPSIDGSYVFASVGADASGGRTASMGVFPVKLGVVQAGGEVDKNEGGVVGPPMSIIGGQVTVDASGRGLIGFSLADNSGLGGVVYMVSPEEILFLSHPGTFPVETGEFFRQRSGGFSDTALDGRAVAHFSGFQDGSAGPDVSAGVLTSDGTGGVTMVLDTNNAGVFVPFQTTSGTYCVGANGRTTTAGFGNTSPILYLIDTNQGLILGADAAVDFGAFGPQSDGPFNAAALSGTFFLGTDGARPAMGTIVSGVLTFDGAGNDTGTQDESTPMGLVPSEPVDNMYAFSAGESVPGRGTLDSGGHTIAYIVSPTKLLYFDTLATKPKVVVAEK